MPNPIKRQLMNEAWNGFARAVLPAGVSETQRREMKRAFYAGGECLLMAVLKMLDPGAQPTDADVEKMDDLHAELLDFAEGVKKGRN
jgi:hypothetical protein